ncbi:beta-galactosidase [Saccharothrix yanglingensis]|uniref:beta-galactosidase n=1 Tax=Saccharothrix yanglingensis TaxID=659496 RepID=UPI0027D2D264|nr:beta-galactosidase trimerization domain-containing protein [Saccharothrix yanglingensis]
MPLLPRSRAGRARSTTARCSTTPDTDIRLFREVAELGREFELVGDAVLGARTPARVALLVDWASWWAVEMSDGPNRNVRHVGVPAAYHRALWQANALVDVVPVTADPGRYDVVVAPLLHVVKGDLADRVAEVVLRGGTFLTTALSGRVDEDDNAFLADVPGPFAGLLGLRVEETDARQPDVVDPVVPSGTAHEARHVFEVVVPEDAEVPATYGADFCAGTPAVTRARRGAGSAWYVATLLDDGGVGAVVDGVLAEHGPAGPLADVPDGEVVERVAPNGTRYAFVLDHGAERVVTCPFDGVDLLTGRQLRSGTTWRSPGPPRSWSAAREPVDVLRSAHRRPRRNTIPPKTEFLRDNHSNRHSGNSFGRLRPRRAPHTIQLCGMQPGAFLRLRW